MSTISLRAGGRALAVRLVPEAGGFAGTVDDLRHRVTVLALGAASTPAAGVTTQEVALEVDGRVHRALVARARGRVLVALDGRVHVFETGAEASGRSAAGRAGSGVVTAPMPGKIVAVLVTKGDAVEPGQPLVVLEAMKMETTLAAEIAGTVAAVHGTAGGMVDGGALLVEITPAA